MMGLLKLLKTRLAPRRARESPQCVAVCIDRSTMDWAGISQSDVDFLVERLRSVIRPLRGAEYDGQEELEDQIRLYFFSADARDLAAELLPVLNDVTWCRGARVRTSAGAAGHWEEQQI